MHAHPLDVVDAVLQAEHDRIAGEVRCDGASSLLGVDGFHAEQHQTGILDGGGIDGGCHGDPLLELERLKQQTLAVDVIDLLRTADDRDAHPGARQHTAEVAADGARAHHCDPRQSFLVHPGNHTTLRVTPTMAAGTT